MKDTGPRRILHWWKNVKQERMEGEVMADWMERKQFGAYISSLRGKKGFSLEQVSEGLCTQQALFNYENGKRSAPKLLQDAVLERLGMGAEDYEHYLDYSEYIHWEARQRILYYITYEEMETAGRLLEQYRATYVEKAGTRDVRGRLERQFYLSMLAQIRCYEGAGKRELSALLEEAVRMTVPRLWEKPPGQRALSLKELNLILEAEQYREGGGLKEHYEEILSYTESVEPDRTGKTKIYPKAVYFLCRCLRENATEEGKPGRFHCREGRARLLRYCNLAIECLRDHSRMYYLWELLEMRGLLLDGIREELVQRGEERKAENLEPMCQENGQWKDVLESVYTEFGVRKETSSYSYFYIEKGVSCINDVIRIRREMLGKSREELCRGFCDVKTLERLEKRKTMPQRATVDRLLERLGLPREVWRAELVAEDPEAMELTRKMRVCMNDRRMEAEELYARIRELVPLEMRCNQQSLLHFEINLREERGELDAEAYCRAMRGALELTMPFEVFLKEGAKYLTHEEQSCIQNMMQKMDKSGGEFLRCMECFEEMYRPFEENHLMGTVNNMYEFIIKYVGSERGNRGDFDQADRYSGMILEECLYFRRLHSIAISLYDRWWNDTKRKEAGLESNGTLSAKTELTRCLLFSRLDKRKYYEKIFLTKLEAQEGSDE